MLGGWPLWPAPCSSAGCCGAPSPPPASGPSPLDMGDLKKDSPLPPKLMLFRTFLLPAGAAAAAEAGPAEAPGLLGLACETLAERASGTSLKPLWQGFSPSPMALLTYSCNQAYDGEVGKGVGVRGWRGCVARNMQGMRACRRVSMQKAIASQAWPRGLQQSHAACASDKPPTLVVSWIFLRPLASEAHVCARRGLALLALALGSALAPPSAVARSSEASGATAWDLVPPAVPEPEPDPDPDAALATDCRLTSESRGRRLEGNVVLGASPCIRLISLRGERVGWGCGGRGWGVVKGKKTSCCARGARDAPLPLTLYLAPTTPASTHVPGEHVVNAEQLAALGPWLAGRKVLAPGQRFDHL